MRLRSPISKRPRVEMIPLIDSVFLILVYFIYAFLSMSVHRVIPLTLPEAGSAEKPQKPYHTLSISKDGALYLDQQPVSLEELKGHLAMLKAMEDPSRLSLSADEAVIYRWFVEVLDTIRKQGIKEVSIETRIKEI